MCEQVGLTELGNSRGAALVDLTPRVLDLRKPSIRSPISLSDTLREEESWPTRSSLDRPGVHVTACASTASRWNAGDPQLREGWQDRSTDAGGADATAFRRRRPAVLFGIGDYAGP